MAIDLFGCDSPQRIFSTPAMRREKARQRMAEKRSTAQGKERANRAAKEWRARNPKKVYEHKYREGQRRAISSGRTYKPIGKRSEREIYSEALLYRNARDAFKFWFSKKTDEEVARWYAATGKPWLNPRLTKSEQHRIRYALDTDYRISEIGRLRLKKIKRKKNIKVYSDNTIKSDLIKTAKSCLSVFRAEDPAVHGGDVERTALCAVTLSALAAVRCTVEAHRWAHRRTMPQSSSQTTIRRSNTAWRCPGDLAASVAPIPL